MNTSDSGDDGDVSCLPAGRDISQEHLRPFGEHVLHVADMFGVRQLCEYSDFIL
jgi:hypothetical protein